MFGLDKNLHDIALSQLSKFDVIEYKNENIQNTLCVVFDVSIDEEIPALLLQLWKFDGGYDHAFYNTMEVDFGLNKRVNHFIPLKEIVTVSKVLSYRNERTEMSEKEQFFFDIWPKTTSEKKSATHTIPFEIQISGTKENSLVLPIWTPLQRIPVEKVKVGTKLETWTVGNVTTIMKVVQL